MIWFQILVPYVASIWEELNLIGKPGIGGWMRKRKEFE
jgi:hypothetical protein